MQRNKKSSPKKLEGNLYDKIVKENLQKMIPILQRRVLGLEVYRTENLPQIRMQITREAEPDFVQKAYTSKYPEGCLLQIEFQTKDEKQTDSKMHFYCAMGHYKHGLPVDLALIFLGKGQPKHIKVEVIFKDLKFQYPIICMDNLSYRDFLNSNAPEEVIMAVLANPESEPPEQIIDLILQRLLELRGNSSEIWKFINQLRVLSMLRNLLQNVELKIKNMVIDREIVRQIQEDELFQIGFESGSEKGIEIGFEKGIEKGIKKGIKKGIEKGKKIGEDIGRLRQQFTAIQHMTESGFANERIAYILDIEDKQVEQIQEFLEKLPEISNEWQKSKPEEVARLFQVPKTWLDAAFE